MVLHIVATNEMSWLCRSPTAMALFHRFTRLWLRRICSEPSAVNAVFSTSLQGDLKRHRPRFPCLLPTEYFRHVGLWVWI